MSNRIGLGPLRWWDLSAALVLAVLCVVAWFLAGTDSPAWAAGLTHGTRYAILLAPLAAYALLYATVGRQTIARGYRGAPSGWTAPVFLGLQVLVISWAVFTEPFFATLQVLAYPTIWSVVQRYRSAVLWSAATALGVSLAMFAGLAPVNPGGGLISAAFSGPLSFGFAVVMGTWITRIFEQGERYRALAEQLHASRAEVIALSESAGAAAERERLSRDLHDTLTQTLTGLVMLSEQADRALANGQMELARERVVRIQTASRSAVEEARALVATTQPLGDGGLEQAIERVAASLREDTGLAVRCDIDPLPLDREVQVVLLRATQEGLANARRHARASEVTIALRGNGGAARLTVEDNGIGLGDASAGGVGQDRTGPSPSGFGLSGLRDRVRLVGGEVRFGAREGGGARLEVIVPTPGNTGSPGITGADRNDGIRRGGSA